MLGLRGPWQRQVCRDMDCLCRRSYGPIRIFFWASCSWHSEGLYGQSLSIVLPIQALRGLLCLGPFSVVWCLRHIEEPPWLGSYSVVWCISHLNSTLGGSYSVVRCIMHLMGQPLYSAAWCWQVGRERLWWWLHPLCMTQQDHLASMASWLSSTGISHHDLLPRNPSIPLSAVNSCPCPGIAPQSINSSSQPLCLLGDPSPCPGYVWLWQGLSDSHSI